MACIGETLGMVPYVVVAALAAGLVEGTLSLETAAWLAAAAAAGQTAKFLFTWRSSMMSHGIAFRALQSTVSYTHLDVYKRQPKGNSIAFEDVSFTYEGAEEPALSHVSFEVPAGSTVALLSLIHIYAAVVEVEHVIRNSLEVMDPMLCHEHGDPFGLPARDGRAKLRDRLEVEVGRRFVQHDECGRCRFRARARHALLLTARKRKEALVDQGCKVELPCRSVHLPFDVGGLESQILAPEGDFPSDVDAVELGFGAVSYTHLSSRVPR